ncbi:preprotein translocase subunit YajC [Skermania sp. ID1734]|uniref:preprotein translocase subunit YajC n=1 Tax=Skermania sp. ID1734 TaxID=2597516 RepID=UPI00117BE074|nr:preprotein translocase subunit YajC [Skermania sp. ID1734]TSD94663.1 preprotein translocase subunit YajC [Skermania sp. ID1734]
MELLFPLLLVALLVPMFLAMRRQKKEMNKTAEMQSALQIGDRVLTTSGLYGTVVDLDDTTVDLEIAEEVITTWSRMAIRELQVEDAHTGDDHDDDRPAATPESNGTGSLAAEQLDPTETGRPTD